MRIYTDVARSHLREADEYFRATPSERGRAVIRRDALLGCGGYDANMPIQGAKDWKCRLSMLERDLRLQSLDRAAFEHRVRPESLLTATLAPEAQASIGCYVRAKHARFYRQHLRRPVDRLDAMAMTLPDLEAQLTGRKHAPVCDA